MGRRVRAKEGQNQGGGKNKEERRAMANLSSDLNSYLSRSTSSSSINSVTSKLSAFKLPTLKFRTQSNLLEGEQEVHRRMRNLFWGCRSRMEQEVAQLHKVGWSRKPMIGCRV